MNTIAENKEESPNKVLFNIFIALSFINILLNILGLPIVKFVYLAQVIVISLMIFTADQGQVFWALAIFSLFEGQGRILWGYNLIFRLIFDILLGGLIVRSIISSKKIINRDVVPNYLIIGIFFHFIWFALELFNPNGAGFIASVATAKIYIFPLLLFFFFQNFPIDLMKVKGQKILLLFNIFLLFTGVIVILQNQMDENFLYGMSPFYQSLFSKFSKFTGTNYRPWGLSFTPGGMSILMYLTLPFLLLFKPSLIAPKNVLQRSGLTLFKWGTISIIGFASFISQVRSATMKYVLILVGFMIFKFIGSRLKFRRVIFTISVFLGVILISPFTSNIVNLDELGLDGALNRYEGLADSSSMANRASFDKFIDVFDTRVDLPFGYGPGMTQSFLPDFEIRRKAHLGIPGFWFWTYDNLFIFLFLELGFGAFIYIFILFSVNLSLVSRVVTLLRWRELTSFAVLSCCTITIFILTVFNWGSVAVTFNPESFFFWFWAGMGFNIYKMTKDKRQKALKEEQLDEAQFDSFRDVSS
ncbi:MAG: hypothetical protein K9K67_16140 [Bacteriovoracaceae bacterium]|nr:hypothetical protein [Bacteriovoracaceae bacterium]